MADNRTLDEIRANDIDNIGHITKHELKEHLFSSKSKAGPFIGTCLFARLRKLGVKIDQHVDERFVDRMLKKHGIKVENRPYDEPEDKWREGLYIYKDNEIVGFISHPQPLGGGAIHLLAPQFVVRTNIDPERG